MDWNYNEVLNLLDTFAAWNRCFTVQEVADWAADPVNLGQLRHSFSQDARFVRLSQTGCEPECFLPEREMFKWWAGFNLRLAAIEQDRLTERQLTAAMNALRPERIWFAPPEDALEYGRELGFVADAWTPGFYVFPIAHILAQVPPHFRQVSRKAFADLESPKLRRAGMRQKASEAVETLLSQFDRRTYRIIKSREALPPNPQKLTLAELGKQLGCTRERVRQIESKFWKRIRHPRIKERSFLIPALITELMRWGGSLALDSGQWENTYIRFLAKAAGVPYIKMTLGNTVLLGVDAFELPVSDYFGSPAERIAPDKVAERLDAGSLSFLGRDDLGLLAAAIAQHNRSRLNRVEKAYLALRSIGDPAHISEITDVYDEMFPGEKTNERNVQGPLERCEEVVWVGTSAFALKEWGYSLPGGTITDTIALIVKEKYENAGRPVHLNAIVAELGRYLPNGADMASVPFTAWRCPTIQQLEGDFFIPRPSPAESQDAADTLD